MTDDTEARLTQTTRQLALLMALDDARDSLRSDDDPSVMFEAILKLLREHFQADTCAVMLVNEEATDHEFIVSYGISEEHAIALCWEAMQCSSPGPVPNEDWPHTLGLRVILDTQLLGAVFLARQGQRFSEVDAKLLETAESQIDSAVIQARRMWQLAQRNRELEAIYQIDHLGDNNSGESDLINSFTSLLMEYFDADLSMVLLTHIDTGEMMIRGIAGRDNISAAALDNIRELTGNLTLPQIIPGPSSVSGLMLLAAPLIVSHVRLGSIVIGRSKRFNKADERLIHAMTTQMDSALMQNRVVQQLSQRNRELEVIYKIDKIRDRELDLDEMTQRVLTEICQAVSSEMGFLMLYNAAEEEHLELKASTVDNLLNSPSYYDIIRRYSRMALQQGDIVHSNRPEGAVRSVIAIPLIFNDRIIGVFGTVNSRAQRGFNAEDRRMLAAITSQIDTAIFERLERRRMRRVLGRSVDPKVLNHLLQQADDRVLQGERVVLTALFADLRGSTEWAERTAPETLVSTLSTFLERMTDVIFKHNGTLDKFVGDEIIALFGTPIPMEDHAYQAVRAATEMQREHHALRMELAEQAIELPAMGVGVSSGEVIAGEIGPPMRTDYTALGSAMNLGARLCSIAPADQIYISQGTLEVIQNLIEAEPVDSVNLKGLGSVPVHRLIRLRGH